MGSLLPRTLGGVPLISTASIARGPRPSNGKHFLVNVDAMSIIRATGYVAKPKDVDVAM